MPSPENVVHISPSQARMRRRLDRVLSYPLRSEVEVIGDGLERAENAAREGTGTIIVWNHFSKRDGFDAGRLIGTSPVWADRPSVFPVGLHQKSKVFDLLDKYAGWTYPYIVTDDTREHEEYKDYKGDDGMPDFLAASRDALAHGGTVSVAFQGGRREFLDLNDNKTTIGTLVASMTRRGVDNFGVLLVGFGEKGREHYEKDDVSGFRVGRIKEIKIGPYFTLEELMDQADGKRKNIDPFIREQFKSLVPPAYLKEPTPETKKAQREKNLERKKELAKNGVLYVATAAVGLAIARNLRKR